MPKDCKLKFFRVLVSTHRTDYLLTNEAEPRETAAAEQESSVRWTIEQFHRELKQLTGVQACQCRLHHPPQRGRGHRAQPGLGLNKPRTRPNRRCISSNKGFKMRMCDTKCYSLRWLLRKS